MLTPTRSGRCGCEVVTWVQHVMAGTNSKGQCAHRGKEWTGSSGQKQACCVKVCTPPVDQYTVERGRVFRLSETDTASVSPVRYRYSECFPCPIHIQRVFPLSDTHAESVSPLCYRYSEFFPCPIHIQRVFPLSDTHAESVSPLRYRYSEFFPYPIYIQQVFPRSDTRTVSVSHISDIDAVSVSPIDLQSEVYVRYSRVNSSGVCKVQPSEQFWCM